jgi:hypothetical protein
LDTSLYTARLKQRIIEADAGEFASDEEMERFFLVYGEPQLDCAVTVGGCAERNNTKQQNQHRRG